MPAVTNIEVESGVGTPELATRGRKSGTSKYAKVVEQIQTLTRRGQWFRVKASNCKGGKFAALVRGHLKNKLEEAEFSRVQVVTLLGGDVGVIRQ